MARQDNPDDPGTTKPTTTPHQLKPSLPGGETPMYDRRRAVTNPAPPYIPQTVTPPPETGKVPTTQLLPVPIYQQGPQRTDVYAPVTEPLPVVYGATRCGAQILYVKVQPDNTLVVLYAICHGPINSISNILIEGKPIANFATTEVYTGTSGQALSTIGSAAEPTIWTSAFPYVAYVVAQFNSPSVTHAAPDWHRFTADVQGMLVRDPRENRFLRSADLSNAAWIKGTGLTVAANGTAPDGSTAWNATDGSGAVESEFDQGTFTVVNDSVTHRLQFRVLKTSGGTSKTLKVVFSLSGGTPVNANVYINTDTGAVLSGSGWTITTDPLNSSWWLCQGARANNSSGNVTLTIQFFPAAAPYNSTTDDVAQQGTATVGMFQLTRLGTVFPSYAYTGSVALVGDPTLASRFYSDNPALVLADFMASPTRTDAYGKPYTYGAWIADAQMDFAGTITTAANDCDVLLADGVTKRFTIGLSMTDKKPLVDWIELIRAHAQLMRPVYNNGLYQINMDKAQSSSGITLTSVGNTANILAAGPLVMKASNQVPTRINASFVNAAANYKDDSIPPEDDPGLAGGTVEFVEKSYAFGQIPYDQTVRLARYIRKRASIDRSAVIRVNAEGIQLLPGIVVPVTSDQLNWSAVDAIITDLRSSQDMNLPSSWEVSVELYSAGVYDDTQATATAYAPPLSPSPYDQPPDVGIPTVDVTDGRAASVYFPAPQTRSSTLYGASSWTTASCGNVTLANIDNGDLATKCFDWNVAADSTSRVDLGSAGAIRAVRISSDNVNLLGVGINAFEYSDNDSTWSDATASGTQSSFPSATMIEVQWPASIGSHRYWRVRKGSSSAQNYNFYEVHFAQFLGEYPNIKEYRIKDWRVGGQKLYDTIPATAIPTSSNPFIVEPIVTRYAGTANYTYSFVIVAVTTAGIENAGVTVSATPSGATVLPAVPQIATSKTLANGANQNVTISAGSGLIEFTGPTLAFQLGGIAGSNIGGVQITFHYDGTQVFTINNEDGGSSATNRIKTNTGGNIALAAGKVSGVFQYSAVASRWVILSLRDSAGAH